MNGPAKRKTVSVTFGQRHRSPYSGKNPKHQANRQACHPSGQPHHPDGSTHQTDSVPPTGLQGRGSQLALVGTTVETRQNDQFGGLLTGKEAVAMPSCSDRIRSELTGPTPSQGLSPTRRERSIQR